MSWNCPCCGDYRLDQEDTCHHCGTHRPLLAPAPVAVPKTEIPKPERDWARDRHRRRQEARNQKGCKAA